MPAWVPGRQITIEALGLGGWTAARTKRAHLNHPGVQSLWESQHIALADHTRRLIDKITVEPQFPRLHQLCRQAPRLKKPGLPEPFVNSETRFRLTHFLPKPIKAAAKGLSGSIGLSRLGGRASNRSALPEVPPDFPPLPFAPRSCLGLPRGF